MREGVCADCWRGGGGLDREVPYLQPETERRVDEEGVGSEGSGCKRVKRRRCG